MPTTIREVLRQRMNAQDFRVAFERMVNCESRDGEMMMLDMLAGWLDEAIVKADLDISVLEGIARRIRNPVVPPVSGREAIGTVKP
jgi:hypothetical protein